MHGVSTEKIQGGKLLRVKVDFDGKINKVQITGDFFAHPEDVIEKMENSLAGIDTSASETEIKEKMDSVIKKTGADIVGIDTVSITRNIMKALGVSQ